MQRFLLNDPLDRQYFLHIANTKIPKARVTFDKKGKNYIAVIDVIGSNGTVLVKDSKIIFTENTGVGKEIGLRLFGKGGSVKFGT